MFYNQFIFEISRTTFKIILNVSKDKFGSVHYKTQAKNKTYNLICACAKIPFYVFNHASKCKQKTQVFAYSCTYNIFGLEEIANFKFKPPILSPKQKDIHLP